MKKISVARLLICVLLSIVFVFIGMSSQIEISKSVMMITVHKSSSEPLTQGSIISQSFISAEDNLESVDVMFTNFGKKVKNGYITLSLENQDGVIISEHTFQVAELRNNSLISLPLNAPIQSCSGKVFVLHIRGNCNDGKGIALRTGPVEHENPSVVFSNCDGINVTDESLYLRTNYRIRKRNSQANVTGILLALCFVACLPLTFREENKYA